MQTTVQKRAAWWNTLSAAWQRAFNEVYTQRADCTDIPNEETLETIWTTPAIRFAGPRAAYPNMSFELSDLSGVTALPQLNILVVINHQLHDLGGIENLKKLKSLFLVDNRISGLDGIEQLEHLEELYVHGNLIRSLQPLSKLTKLRMLVCNDNQLTSLEGIGEQHTAALERFICLPNKGILYSEILKFELQTGIKCQKG